ncbi:MAG: YceI family protein [Chloroflexi bacterium]|nr:YceI family protein [Chloroflexota bacterium]
MKSKLLAITFVITLLSAACSTPAPTAPPAPTGVPPTVAPVITPTSAPQPTAAPQNSPTTQAQPTTAPAASGDNLRFVLVEGSNEARYRVREQLARVNLPGDAIGATKTITGVIVTTKDGKIVKEQSKITIDISKLQSDSGQRDNFLRDNTLQTRRFPTVVFVPTEAQGLAWPIKDGPIEFKLIGDMTVRDVTKSIPWDVKLTVTGNDAKGQASTSFKFAFFNIEPPRVPTVLSIEDNIKLEIDLTLKKQ